VGHLSGEEIERMVEAAARMKEEDDKIMARIEARNQLEQVCCSALQRVAECCRVLQSFVMVRIDVL